MTPSEEARTHLLAMMEDRSIVVEIIAQVSRMLHDSEVPGNTVALAQIGLQDAASNIASRNCNLEAGRRPLPYLIGCAYNAAIDQLRKDGKIPTQPLEAASNIPAPDTRHRPDEYFVELLIKALGRIRHAPYRAIAAHKTLSDFSSFGLESEELTKMVSLNPLPEHITPMQRSIAMAQYLEASARIFGTDYAQLKPTRSTAPNQP